MPFPLEMESLESSETRWVDDNFECPISHEDTTQNPSVVTDCCNRAFLETALVQYEQAERSKKKNGQIKCPICRQPLTGYRPVHWPRTIVDFREQLVVRLQAIERQKKELANSKAAMEQQVVNLRLKQEQSQRLLEQFRTQVQQDNEAIAKRNQEEKARLLKQIKEKEKQAATGKEQQTELENLRQQVGELEVASSSLQGEMRKREQEMNQLQAAVRQGQMELSEKERLLGELQRELEERQAAEVAMRSQPAAAVDESVNVAGVAASGASATLSVLGTSASWAVWMATEASQQLTKGFKYITSSYRAPSSMLKRTSDFEVVGRVGGRLDCPVWRARDCRTGSGAEEVFWALKRKNKRDLHHLREAGILSHLSHPNIVAMEGFVVPSDARSDSDEICLILPFFEMELEYLLAPDLVGANQLRYNDSKPLLYGIVAAISYAHSQEVVHRNLSPSAILVRSAHFPSPVIGSWTEAASLASPPYWPLVSRYGNRYQAPEYLLGEQMGSLDWKAFDLWALGCLAWEIFLNNSRDQPLVPVVTRNLRDQLQALFLWTELRDQAASWLATQDKDRFRVLEQVLSAGPMPNAQSMREHLQSKMLGPDEVNFVMGLLAWDPRKRTSAQNLVADRIFSGLPPPPAGRDVQPGELSDASLEEWLKACFV